MLECIDQQVVSIIYTKSGAVITMYSVDNGLVTLDRKGITIKNMLLNLFDKLSYKCCAEPKVYPSLLPISALQKLDYFTNFPHLALCATPINETDIGNIFQNKKKHAIAHASLKDSEYVLPMAACFGIYLSISNATIEKTQYIVTEANCFRNESHYNDLERLWAFTMKEIVCIGSATDAQRHVSDYKTELLKLCRLVNLEIDVQVALDPFFNKESSQAQMQKVFPVKEEFVFGGSIAISSVNYHRDFFGNRCEIILNEQGCCHTSCVAFGVERWMYALIKQYDRDYVAIREVLQGAISKYDQDPCPKTGDKL